VTVAAAVGGNAAVLADRAGFERVLLVPGVEAPAARWQEVFEGARLRAERALARPATHAVLALATAPERQAALQLHQAAAAAGLDLLDIVAASALPAGLPAVEAAAIRAEELAPRAEGG